MPTARDLPIPFVLNTWLVAALAPLTVSLLLCAGHLHGALYVLGVAIYALLFQTVFALFHEASHHKLHPDGAWNRGLGRIVGTLFGLPYSFFALSHWAHHLKNRTDEEAFDLIGPGDDPWAKQALWFAMLSSVWYWVMPLMNVVLVVAPHVAAEGARRLGIAERVFRQPESMLRRIRYEAAACVGWGLVVLALGGWWAVLMHACAAWLWSSTNYVEHAYAPRDVLLGAYNLRSPVYGWFTLHRELDRAHHLYPAASWVHLPQLVDQLDGDLWRHWARQWRGPIPTTERGPEPIREVPVYELP